MADGLDGRPGGVVVEHCYPRRVRGFALFVFGAAPDEARAGRGPSLPRNATSMPFSEK